MMTQTDEKPTIAERYTCANHATVLVAEAKKRGPLDLIIAAGMSQHRLGAALLRLHSEWDASAKPQIMRAEDCLPGLLAGHGADKPSKAEMLVLKARAGEQARAANYTEARLILGKLRTLPTVRAGLFHLAFKWFAQDADKIVSACLYWWLDRNCPVCQGRCLETAKGAPALTRVVCRECHGTGRKLLPYGDRARRVVDYMQSSTEFAAADMGRRTRNRMR